MYFGAGKFRADLYFEAARRQLAGHSRTCRISRCSGKTDLRYSHLPLDSIGFENFLCVPELIEISGFFRLVDLKDSLAFQSQFRGLPGGMGGEGGGREKPSGGIQVAIEVSRICFDVSLLVWWSFQVGSAGPLRPEGPVAPTESGTRCFHVEQAVYQQPVYQTSVLF